MRIIPVDNPADPCLADYFQIKERQWATDFQPSAPGVPGAPHGKFMAEGELVLQQLVRSGARVLSLLLTRPRLESAGAELALLAPDVPVYVAPAAMLEPLVGFPLHRGLMAIAARPRPLSVNEVLAAAGDGPILLPEDLTNHDNIGSIFRNASCLGARGVILSPRCADPLYRKSLRVSMGHVLRVPWAIAPSWPGVLDDLRAAGWTVAALHPGEGSRDIAAGGLPRSRVALVLGTEGPGVSPGALAKAALRLRIEMVPGADSLNVAVSSAIALHRLRGEPDSY